MTVLERYDALVNRWLHTAKRNNLTESSVQNYISCTKCFREFLQTRAENGMIGDGYVSFDDVQAWIDEMAENGNKPTTIKQRLVVIGQFFNFCAKPYIPDDLRYAQSPVSRDFYPKTVTEQIPEILPDEAIIKLWKYERKYSATDAQFARNYALVVLILTTGLRNKEVLDLRLSDVDFMENEISVKNGKGRKARIVDMPDICSAALMNYLHSGARPATLSDQDYLFGTTAAHAFGVQNNSIRDAERWHRGTTAWLSSVVERHVRNQTGVSGVRSHDLRHLFARVTLNATGNLAELQGAMGHTSPIITEKYSGRLMQRRKRASARAVLRAREEAAEEVRKHNAKQRRRVIAFPA